MGGGPPSFPQGSSCPVVLRIPDNLPSPSPTGLSPAPACLSSAVRLKMSDLIPVHYPGPKSPSARFGLFPVRSPLLGKSMFLSLPPGTSMFQFPGSPLHNLLIQLWISGHYPGWVSPFGYPWLIACFRLSMAFRRSLRPSSAPGAKAFTLCSFQLDLTLVLSLRNRSVVPASAGLPPTSFFLVLCIVQFSRYI